MKDSFLDLLEDYVKNREFDFYSIKELSYNHLNDLVSLDTHVTGFLLEDLVDNYAE